jgi:hypothetical protein
MEEGVPYLERHVPAAGLSVTEQRTTPSSAAAAMVDGVAPPGGSPVDAWMQALAAVSRRSPHLVPKRACAMRITVGAGVLGGGDGARAWSVVTTAAAVAVSSCAPTGGSWDCELEYRSQGVWAGVVGGAVNPRTAMKQGDMAMQGGMRTLMGMRRLFKAAGEGFRAAGGALSGGGSSSASDIYTVRVRADGVGRSARRGGAGGGPACCAAGPARASAGSSSLVRALRYVAVAGARGPIR